MQTVDNAVAEAESTTTAHNKSSAPSEDIMSPIFYSWFSTPLSRTSQLVNALVSVCCASP